MIDPASLKLDASRLDAALAEINAGWKAFDPEHHTHEASEFEGLATFADLLEHYDYGEPEHNGTLNWLAAKLLVDPPTTRTIDSQDDLPKVDVEYISYFHHGDLVVNGDFGAYKSMWVTGDLIVEGVIEASYLDAYADLMVAGDVKCRAMSFMGLAMIAGRLDVTLLAYLHAQGSNFVLKGVRGPFLLGEYEYADNWDASQVEHRIDIGDPSMGELAALLGVDVDPKDEYPHEIVYRAFNACRADA